MTGDVCPSNKRTGASAQRHRLHAPMTHPGSKRILATGVAVSLGSHLLGLLPLPLVAARNRSSHSAVRCLLRLRGANSHACPQGAPRFRCFCPLAAGERVRQAAKVGVSSLFWKYRRKSKVVQGCGRLTQEREFCKFVKTLIVRYIQTACS